MNNSWCIHFLLFLVNLISYFLYNRLNLNISWLFIYRIMYENIADICRFFLRSLVNLISHFQICVVWLFLICFCSFCISFKFEHLNVIISITFYYVKNCIMCVVDANILLVSFFLFCADSMLLILLCLAKWMLNKKRVENTKTTTNYRQQTHLITR